MNDGSGLVRIGLVLCSDRKGGLENAFVDMAYALTALGYKVVVFTPGNAPFRLMMPDSVEFHDYNPKGYWDIFSGYKTRRYIKNNNLELMVTINSRATYTIAKSVAGLNLPVLGISYSYKHKRMQAADRLVVVTEHMKAHYLQHGWSADNVDVLPCVLRDFPVEKIPSKPVESVVKLGFVGRLSPEKGLEELVEAMSLLIGKGRTLSLTIAGSGDDEHKIHALLEQKKLQQSVVFSGWITDIRKWLKTIDLLVVPSKEETFGIVVLESMAHGCPVVSTCAPGPASQIEHGVTGWLAETGNAESLAKVIDVALSQADSWEHIIDRARASASKYSIEAQLPKLKNIIQQVLKK
ncbi:Glycosyltransferase [Nitrincola lacisaponensis]|uniref:Glycosyltransferase n=1 Tax=Nitrincola lacisaponensis TaxID=267850 RepID=A0A063Y5Q7_9GAMM|nr:glycosyltransferase [Nitrincola lacisaponensis]KDE40106.1 Glycosyltransferase [Nitrincola lacisaponensis]